MGPFSLDFVSLLGSEGTARHRSPSYSERQCFNLEPVSLDDPGCPRGCDRKKTGHIPCDQSQQHGLGGKRVAVQPCHAKQGVWKTPNLSMLTSPPQSEQVKERP